MSERFTIHNQLADYVLGRLDGLEREVFEEHLSACAECRRELGGLSMTAAMLRAAPRPDPRASHASRHRPEWLNLLPDSDDDMSSQSLGAAKSLHAHESALVERVAAGDRREPLTELYQRYAGRLYGLGVRLLGDEGLAEELVQETFVRLWRSAPRFDSEQGTVRTFLFTIARRAAVDLRRRPSSRPLAELSEDGGGAASDDAFESLLLGLEVRDAMEALSDDHRETLELYYEHDLSQRQISERLGVPIGTVKTRTHYALRALRDALEERELL